MVQSWLIAGACLVLLTLPAVALRAEDPAAAGNAEAEKAVLLAAASHVRLMTMHEGSRGEKVVELIDQPLLAFGDSARVHNHGTLWAWGKKGRPVAYLELFQQSGLNGQWIQSLTLSGAANVALDTPDSGRWQPQTTAFELKPLPDAPMPAAKEAARTRQLKDAARRFTAHEFWDPDRSRYELRLLVQPVHRYSDPEKGLQDGAVFVFAHGTNPECLLMIDAVGESLTAASWKFAPLRSADAEVHVELDGHEVWKCERIVHSGDERSKPYWVFASSREATVDGSP